MAELLRGQECRCRRADRRLQPWNDPHRGSLSPMWITPRSPVSRRSRPDWSALLHEQPRARSRRRHSRILSDRNICTAVLRTTEQQLLLGEWACLGILYAGPSHGFAIAARLKPTGDVGRVWSMSRALTYRSLDQLVARGYVHAVGEEPGIAGGNRT